MVAQTFSPQAQAIVQKLLAGESVGSGAHAIGPLPDGAKILLGVFVANLAELTHLTGDSRARRVRELFVEAEAVTEDEGESDTSTHKPLIALSGPPGWRLHHLRCQAIRGIAPAREEFEFEFDGHSHLICGPNGSGKSSLLGAVVWLFTGAPLTDAAEQQEVAPIYEKGEGAKVGRKIRDWPVVATLPNSSDVGKATPNSFVELLLARPTDNLRLRLRRQFGGRVESSLDGKTWTSVENLTQIGIDPLDVQLSLTAPTVFGKRAIEEASDARSILSLMLGLDDLEVLGGLASQISMNRTRLANAERREIDVMVKGLANNLQLLPTQLPEGSKGAQILTDLAGRSTLHVSDLDRAKTDIDKLTAEAEAHLAQALGLARDTNAPPSGLADRLTVAVDALGKGAEASFPSLAGIRLSNALPDSGDRGPQTQFANLQNALQTFIVEAKRAILDRYDWWKQEIATKGRNTLLLNAAQHYQPELAECPICGKTIDDEGLHRQLVSLGQSDSALGSELSGFFSSFVSRLNNIVPARIAALADRTARTRLETDWAVVRDNLLGPPFKTLTSKFEEPIHAIREKISTAERPSEPILPADCEAAFAVAAEPLRKAIEKNCTAIGLLRWGTLELDSVLKALDDVISGASGSEATLLGQLERGKEAANTVKPLSATSRALNNYRATQASIESKREQVKVLERLEEPLDNLKALSKFAEAAVRQEFDSIRTATTTNLKALYPETPTGMQVEGLKLGTGRDKTIEALLSAGAFDVPGQHFANAGLQRATALAFYFALLEKHRGGLGFIVMDDPILSLDEDHRERWSARILRPKLPTTQFLLATHQKQFLRFCRQDFAGERVVELNHRDRERRISWKPGDRLKRAEQQLETVDHLTAAMTLRKFREEIFLSLDAYCPDGFYDSDDLKMSVKRYEGFASPHPLAGAGQAKIMKCLRLPEVQQVLDPASHAKTDADVTKPMVEDCMKQLQALNPSVSKELGRLDRLRDHSLRGSAIAASVVSFPALASNVSWSNYIDLQLIGAAAAKSNSWSVEFSQEGGVVQFAPGSAIQVHGDALEPVARHGQWVLLADEASTIRDGDLAAICDSDEAPYLRRVWSDGHNWLLQSINPVRPTAALRVEKRNVGIRKILGVLYRPLGTAIAKSGHVAEWLPCSSINSANVLKSCRAIAVLGESLEPLARNGQKVLVDEPLTDFTKCPQGELAVIDFKDEGGLIKQVFRDGKQWTLLSPNPVDRLTPIVTSESSIRAVWLLRGVLFEVSALEADD